VESSTELQHARETLAVGNEQQSFTREKGPYMYMCDTMHETPYTLGKYRKSGTSLTTFWLSTGIKVAMISRER
jgi:hypothetical protein